MRDLLPPILISGLESAGSQVAARDLRGQTLEAAGPTSDSDDSGENR